jgi:hypothetical protein
VHRSAARFSEDLALIIFVPCLGPFMFWCLPQFLGLPPGHFECAGSGVFSNISYQSLSLWKPTACSTKQLHLVLAQTP